MVQLQSDRVVNLIAENVKIVRSPVEKFLVNALKIIVGCVVYRARMGLP